MNIIFLHGVASADPLTDRVVIWTRITTVDAKPVPVNWQVAHDAEFKSIAASGATNASTDFDFTVNVDVTGLEPGTRYYYRFDALGETSAVGRTRTLALPTRQVESPSSDPPFQPGPRFGLHFGIKLVRRVVEAKAELFGCAGFLVAGGELVEGSPDTLRGE